VEIEVVVLRFGVMDLDIGEEILQLMESSDKLGKTLETRAFYCVPQCLPNVFSGYSVR
jgi:hypothetical protein